ncbi:hypothetical protein [Sphingomonas sp. BK069]|uniref:hypothetical protein n=1 Tax=Sphingomonas sp. BK069 TaxID=2586979 RepID=UPI00161EFB4A|nr:hypothetical protein [Sphingomonas sp. BK069]MBB3349807.1 hypothetical protein [Sphingomonas sp. BK069]
MVQLPDVGALRPGDILLTRNVEASGRKGNKDSMVIRRVTNGRFSHALICSSPPSFVEAIGSGVSTLSLARCFAHEIANVRVLRHPDLRISARAARLAQYEVGRDYSLAGAIGSVFPAATIGLIGDRGIFCSALVAHVFAAAGCLAFQSLAMHRVTPAALDDMDFMVDVTAEIFRPALAPRNVEAMSALDGDRVLTPSARQTAISNAFAKALLPEADRIAATYPELELQVTPALNGILDLLVKANERSDRVEGARRADLLADLVAFDELAASGLIRSGLSELLTEVMAADDEMLQRSLEQSFQARPDIDVVAMRGYLKASREQLATRRGGLRQWESWGLHRSKAVTINHAIDSRAAEATERRVRLLEEIIGRID